MSTKPAAPTLYRSLQIESEAKRAELTADVIAVLRHGYSLQILGNFPGREGTLYVRTGYADPRTAGASPEGIVNGYAMWEICDNGGEFNVTKVNSTDLPRSVPYVARKGIVNAGTVAYQIAMIIKGQPIDWAFSADDVVETCRELAAAAG